MRDGESSGKTPRFMEKTCLDCTDNGFSRYLLTRRSKYNMLKRRWNHKMFKSEIDINIRGKYILWIFLMLYNRRFRKIYHLCRYQK